MPRDTKKLQRSVRIPERTLQIIEAVARLEGTSPGEKMTEYLRRYVTELIIKGEIPSEILQQEAVLTDFDLLKDFLNCLLDTGGHDGFSLAEIAGMLGRESDKELLELVKKLKNGNGSKEKKPSGVKP